LLYVSRGVGHKVKTEIDGVGLKAFSPAFSNVNVSAVGDETGLFVVEVVGYEDGVGLVVLVGSTVWLLSVLLFVYVELLGNRVGYECGGKPVVLFAFTDGFIDDTSIEGVGLVAAIIGTFLGDGVGISESTKTRIVSSPMGFFVKKGDGVGLAGVIGEDVGTDSGSIFHKTSKRVPARTTMRAIRMLR